MGYANRTTMDILNHLFTNYAQLTPTELADNMMVHLVKPWDPSTPFETVINQIERCTEFADDGGAPIPAQIILNTAYTLVFNSGAYFDEIRDWERKPAAERATWDQFKAYMLEAQTRHNRM